MNKAYIAFGANLPDGSRTPADTIGASVRLLRGRGIRILSVSRLWQSPAWPDPNEPDYVNAVAEIATYLSPFALLHTLRCVEQKFGRKRGLQNAPRTLDLDLISYEQLCLHTRHLTLPHPRMMARAFVLLPLYDVCPQWRMPGTGCPLTVLIKALPEGHACQALPGVTVQDAE